MKKFLDIYRERLRTDYNDSTGFFAMTEDNEADYKHLLWMLEEIEKMTDESKRNRWIGFIQGYFWSIRLFTIDEMREHVRELIAKP